MSNDEVIKKMRPGKAFILKIRERSLNFLGHMKENVTFSRYTEGLKNIGNERATYQTCLCGWMVDIRHKAYFDNSPYTNLLFSHDINKFCVF